MKLNLTALVYFLQIGANFYTIYLSDSRKTALQKYKIIIRCPIRKI